MLFPRMLFFAQGFTEALNSDLNDRRQPTLVFHTYFEYLCIFVHVAGRSHGKRSALLDV